MTIDTCEDDVPYSNVARSVTAVGGRPPRNTES